MSTDAFPIEVETERGLKAIWAVPADNGGAFLSVNEVDRHTGWHRTSCGWISPTWGHRWVACPWIYRSEQLAALPETYPTAEAAVVALVQLRFAAETLSEVRDA